MEVAQRGTSGTIKYTFSSQYAAFLCVDRWGFKNGGASDLGTASQVSAGLTGFSRALKVQRPNGSASTPQFRMAQALESIDAIRLQGKAVTLSFYAKAGANFSATLGRINALIAYETGSEQPTANFLGGSATAAVVSEDKTLNTAWQRFSLTGTVPAGAVQLAVRFVFTPTGTAGADDSVYITGVQLEEGALAMAFENRSYADELRLCQRHYFKARNTFNAGLALAAVVSGTSSVSVIRPPVPMRTIPIDLTYLALPIHNRLDCHHHHHRGWRNVWRFSGVAAQAQH